MKKLEDYVVSIPDFPEPGIIFRDVTSILQDADGLALAIDSIREMVKDLEYDVVVGPESRGFIFGVPVAYAEHKSFVPIRKKGKLPCETIEQTYCCTNCDCCDKSNSLRKSEVYHASCCHNTGQSDNRTYGKVDTAKDNNHGHTGCQKQVGSILTKNVKHILRGQEGASRGREYGQENKHCQ